MSLKAPLDLGQPPGANFGVPPVVIRFHNLVLELMDRELTKPRQMGRS